MNSLLTEIGNQLYILPLIPLSLINIQCKNPTNIASC